MVTRIAVTDITDPGDFVDICTQDPVMLKIRIARIKHVAILCQAHTKKFA